MTPGLDEDLKELRVKAMLMAECTVSLRCLREGMISMIENFSFFLSSNIQS
jgi:hypothetical protein